MPSILNSTAFRQSSETLFVLVIHMSASTLNNALLFGTAHPQATVTSDFFGFFHAPASSCRFLSLNNTIQYALERKGIRSV